MPGFIVTYGAPGSLAHTEDRFINRRGAVAELKQIADQNGPAVRGSVKRGRLVFSDGWIAEISPA